MLELADRTTNFNPQRLRRRRDLWECGVTPVGLGLLVVGAGIAAVSCMLMHDPFPRSFGGRCLCLTDPSGAPLPSQAAWHQSPDTYFCRAQVACERGEFEQAVKEYSIALHFEPRNMAARFKRAKAREKTGDLIGAVEDMYQVEKYGRPGEWALNRLTPLPVEKWWELEREEKLNAETMNAGQMNYQMRFTP